MRSHLASGAPNSTGVRESLKNHNRGTGGLGWARLGEAQGRENAIGLDRTG